MMLDIAMDKEEEMHSFCSLDLAIQRDSSGSGADFEVLSRSPLDTLVGPRGINTVYALSSDQEEADRQRKASRHSSNARAHEPFSNDVLLS